MKEILPNKSTNLSFAQEENQLQRCEIFLQKCENHSFSAENLSELLEGELVLNNTAYQYIGESLDFKNIIKDKIFKKINFKKTTIVYDKNIEVKETSNGKQLDIYQKAPGARVYIINGEIENLKINFYGYKIKENELNLENFPIDINGLTGCLSIINLKVKNISINAADSTCEDAVNFINVAGSINEVVQY